MQSYVYNSKMNKETGYGIPAAFTYFIHTVLFIDLTWTYYYSSSSLVARA